ncbi:uncharacterized protein LOC129903982 [Solanum dulcamara]|uniref:uncharacterized protein LOC129903982 n=1 Tax=Solanum dulcamara TaxID=45834 RepID=UPI002485EA48|nr:uncharacterized protein LOC129903982 [Solanum dulcamara]
MQFSQYIHLLRGKNTFYNPKVGVNQNTFSAPSIRIELIGKAAESAKTERKMEEITSARKTAEVLKPKVAIQCAKSAILISSLKNTTLNYANLNQNKNEENLKEVVELKMEIVKEKLKNKRLKLCSVTELLIQVIVLLSVWTMLLLLALN